MQDGYDSDISFESTTICETLVPLSPQTTASSAKVEPGAINSPTVREFVSVKVVHEDTIIMLRVSLNTSFVDLRQRIYNKLVGQEGIALSESFSLSTTSKLIDSQLKWDTLIESGTDNPRKNIILRVLE